jgi:predicted permease
MDSEGVLTERRNRCFYVMARPARGQSLARIQGELDALGAELERRYPADNRGMKVRALPISRSTQGVQSIAAQPLAILAIAVALVLLIACVNVANLILARLSGRERELAIRQALGAGRGRLMRQLLTESLVLGLAGGAVGFLASLLGTGLLPRLAPPTYLPLVLRGGAGPGSFAFAFGLSLLASLIMGLVPALRSSSVHAGALKDGARGSVGPRMRKLQGALVVAQVALAVMLLVGAGLLVKSYRNTRRADPGFVAHQVMVAGFGLENTGYSREKTAQVGKALLERVRALPGVQAAAMSQELIMGFEGASWDYFQIEGREEDPRERLRLFRNIVSPGFFGALGIPIVAGREFSELDRSDTQPVVVINEALAQKYWPGQDPLGKRLRTGGRFWTVVGVCRSTRSRTWTDPVSPFVYYASAQADDDGCHVLYVRSAQPLSTFQPALAGALRGVDADLPLLVDSLERIVDSAAWTIALAAKVLGVLGLLALVLAAVGIYGVIATSVGQRIPEFGIRMSLGADSWRILGLVLGQGGTLVGLGLALGIPAALALSQGLSTLLMGVDPQDPAIFLGVPGLLALVALLACALPALRASRVNPLEALRQE